MNSSSIFSQPKEYILAEDAASEPLTLSEVKTHLRLDGSDYDDILTPLIKTARQFGEEITGRDFINKTYKCYLDAFPTYCDGRILIKKSKLQSITSIKYYLDDVLTTLDSSIYYITDSPTYASIYLKNNQSYPVTIDERKQAVEITFVAGYGASASSVPQGLKQAMLSHITYLYKNAGDCANDYLQFRELYFPYIIADKLVDFV